MDNLEVKQPPKKVEKIIQESVEVETPEIPVIEEIKVPEKEVQTIPVVEPQPEPKKVTETAAEPETPVLPLITEASQEPEEESNKQLNITIKEEDFLLIEPTVDLTENSMESFLNEEESSRKLMAGGV